MRKIDLLLGIFMAIVAAILGSFIFIEAFTNYSFLEGFEIMKSQRELGKIITLGSILNIIVFFTLLKLDKELMARGVVLGTILLTIVTLFV
ncbi:hypothetical protein [Flavobacterium luteum]|uniref:DUF3784 domain-containing protein n=1 Tax=Flavobacterium luteum TaxID=2026654 RepID=A0A7J5AGP4_9FLAO|nr:hypothetical protein [Flavobacterium luteum]KAB1156754.1 hypothetical protein F6464_05210 [Flavobacterium luteum]